MNMNEAKNSTQGRRATAWLNVALVCMLVALLSGVGATFGAVSDAQKHASNDEYLDAKLVWDRNDGNVTGSASATNRILPATETTVTLAAQNTGNQNMFARVKLNYKWVACEKSEDGYTFTKVKDINAEDDELTSNGALFTEDKLELAVSEPASDEKWQDGEDGYFYYNQGDDPILAGVTTGNLTATVSVSGEVGDTYNTNTHHELSAEENRYVEYNTDGTEKASYYTGVEVDAQLEAVTKPFDPISASSIAKTGDSFMFSPLTMALIALTVLSIVACLLSFLKGRKRVEEECE